jgi:hypothetical protein
VVVLVYVYEHAAAIMVRVGLTFRSTLMSLAALVLTRTSAGDAFETPQPWWMTVVSGGGTDGLEEEVEDVVVIDPVE